MNSETRTTTARTGAGTVTLVGAGPGAADLITLAGARALAGADVVLMDRLAPRELLEHTGPGTRVIDVGKAPGAHVATQDQINVRLVAEARAGHRVVRLKGGDPYVLGRGGEEAAFLREHGIDVSVVPGVTSAVSVPAAAGIPVTHRGLATGFTVVTGHEELGDVPVRADHTLVVLMGVARLESTVAALRSRGLDGTTPVAIVERGFLPDQRSTIATLATIAARARAIGVSNPAVIVIGDVVTLADMEREDFFTSALAAEQSAAHPNLTAKELS
ncbi:uroporphyrinogen-III C-methyltransferase [Zhihengliuella salsuginis]|uniref:uroporphyrinogen-III C-methyltransferase n=1 Tax=Zhihengliuella salsuginis TaxID=578222 RepID=A0ABQ3GEB4_9MICC|nr:hypothetical protein GCM10008096_06470 [Zhihengliuella salsuginis]